MNRATTRQVIRRTEKEKLTLIGQWEKSGLSIKRFCDEHRFSDSLFHGWLNKYRRHPPKAPAPKKAFIPVQITAPSAISAQKLSAPYAEVVLSNASRVTFYQPVSVDFLRTLIA